MSNIDPSLPVVSVVFKLQGEPDSEWFKGFAMPHDGRLWLISNWLESNATGMRIPAQLIPMEKFPHNFERPDHLVEITAPIPKELLSQHVPESLRLEYEVVDYPGAVHIPGPSSTH